MRVKAKNSVCTVVNSAWLPWLKIGLWILSGSRMLTGRMMSATSLLHVTSIGLRLFVDRYI